MILINFYCQIFTYCNKTLDKTVECDILDHRNKAYTEQGYIHTA